MATRTKGYFFSLRMGLNDDKAPLLQIFKEIYLSEETKSLINTPRKPYYGDFNEENKKEEKN